MKFTKRVRTILLLTMAATILSGPAFGDSIQHKIIPSAQIQNGMGRLTGKLYARLFTEKDRKPGESLESTVLPKAVIQVYRGSFRQKEDLQNQPILGTIDFRKEKSIHTIPTDADGFFFLDLKPGTYSLFHLGDDGLVPFGGWGIAGTTSPYFLSFEVIANTSVNVNTVLTKAKRTDYGMVIFSGLTIP